MLRALLLGAFVLVPAAAASTIVVPVDQPTIQAAVNAAVDGDVIEIHAGVYPEAVVITSKNGLLLTGKGKVRLVAPILGTALTLTGCDGVTVEKLGFEGPGTGLGIVNCGTITVTKCRFQNLDAGLASSGATDETIVEDCLFKTIRVAAVAVDNGLATLTHNRVQGAQIGFNLVGCAMTMTGNNVRKATQWGIRIYVPPTDADSVVEDNVIDGCRAFGIFLVPGEITTGQLSIRHNLIKNVAQGAINSLGNFANQPSKILVEQNTIRNAGYQGIEFSFYAGQLSLLSNDLRKIRGRGFELSSLGDVDLSLADNVVKSPGFDGVRSSIDAGTLSGNQIKSCGRFGVYLSGTGSTLTGNVLLGSKIFDLYQAGGANVVLPDNSIGSSGP